MNIILETPGFKVSPNLEQVVHDKIKKLFEMAPQIIRAEVTLYEGADGNIQNRYCVIRLVVPGNDYFVKKNTDAYEKSIEEAQEALQSMIRRDKAKEISNRRH